VHQSIVETVDQGERLIETGRMCAQRVSEHQRTTTPAAGNHCSSGSGSVLGGNSR
jgi:hypothetical protein